MNTAFVSATPILARSTISPSVSSLSSRRPAVAAPTRRPAAISMMADEKPPKIPQGFTAFSELLNGRAAMIGFVLAVATEALTGKGVIGQVASIFDISNVTSTLGH